jgi:hypothetical protein
MTFDLMTRFRDYLLEAIDRFSTNAQTPATPAPILQFFEEYLGIVWYRICLRGLMQFFQPMPSQLSEVMHSIPAKRSDQSVCFSLQDSAKRFAGNRLQHERS